MKKQHYSLGLFPLSDNAYSIKYWNWWKHWINPKNYYRTIKYFCQRGYRGYADCDSWDADSYMEAVMLSLLTRLQTTKHGYPSGLCTCKKQGDADDNWCENTVDCDGSEVWNSILQEIIDGLEASKELSNEETVLPGTYSDEPFEFEDVPGSNGLLRRIKETGVARFNNDLYEQWAEPLRKKEKRAMLLLCKHWGSFWD